MGDARRTVINKKELLKEDYPMNLLLSIQEVSVYDFDIPVEISNDIRAGIQYAISTLEQREQEIIHLRYVERRTLSEISVHFSISPERVRQIEAVALRNLRMPSRWNYIQNGVEGYLKLCVVDEYKKGYSDGYDAGYLDKSKNLENKNVCTTLDNKLKEYPIDILNLSVRSYNCLYIYGCRTVGDCAKLTREQIMRIKRIGRKSLIEIANALCLIGIRNTAWEKYLLQD